MSPSGPAEKSPAFSKEENRRRALAGVQAIFDRYGRPPIVFIVLCRIASNTLPSALDYRNIHFPAFLLESTTATNTTATGHPSYTLTKIQPACIIANHSSPITGGPPPNSYKLVQARVGPAFDNATMDNCVVLDASVGPPPLHNDGAGTSRPTPDAGVKASCTTRLLIGADMGNYNGVMHGGAAGVIFDMLTTIALGPVARPGFWSFLGGVTRTLNISYLKAVPIGTTVIVHSYVYQVGRQTAYIKGWMTSEDGKTIYAVCDHHKIHVPTPAEHLTLKVPWDEQWDEEGKEQGKTASKL